MKVFLFLSMFLFGITTFAKSYVCENVDKNINLKIDFLEASKAQISIKSPVVLDMMCEAKDFQNAETKQIVKGVVCGDNVEALPEIFLLNEVTLRAKIEFNSFEAAELICR